MSVTAWEWRKASGGFWCDTDRWSGRTLHRLFHAYDGTDHCACEPSLFMPGTAERPNEGSELCRACIAVVSANRAAAGG